MGNSTTGYCAGISIGGIIYLVTHIQSSIGGALISEYDYIPISSDKKTAGWNCLYTAIAYVVVLIICITVRCFKNRESTSVKTGQEDVQMTTFNEVRIPNPAFESADGRTNLLSDEDS